MLLFFFMPRGEGEGPKVLTTLFFFCISLENMPVCSNRCLMEKEVVVMLGLAWCTDAYMYTFVYCIIPHEDIPF
jgi:hypothetical protein